MAYIQNVDIQEAVDSLQLFYSKDSFDPVAIQTLVWAGEEVLQT